MCVYREEGGTLFANSLVTFPFMKEGYIIDKLLSWFYCAHRSRWLMQRKIIQNDDLEALIGFTYVVNEL